MKKILNSVLLLMLIFALFCPVCMAQNNPPSAGLKIVDALLVRLPCVAASAGSTAIYVAISPLTYLMGIGEPLSRVMVEAPWRFTSARYLGEFDHYKDEGPITVIDEW